MWDDDAELQAVAVAAGNALFENEAGAVPGHPDWIVEEQQMEW